RAERRGDPPIANDIRVTDDGTGEVPGAQAVHRIRVPDAADVETVAHAAEQLVAGDAVSAVEDDVRCRDRRARVELPPAADREPEAVARRERALRGVVRGRAELLAARRIPEQALGLVPARETPREHAVADQVRAPGRKSLARDRLRADQLHR